MSETILKEEERVAFALRSLYRRYGYLPYKMNKFETYDLYASNKDFLVGDGVITFNDTDGKLLALKPDVTLSIIKNTAENTGKQKVYYNENVYRISGETKQFKEIMQLDGVKFSVSESALDEISNQAIKLSDGARGLRTILENTMLDTMYRLPDEKIKCVNLTMQDKKLKCVYNTIETNQNLSVTSSI